MATDYAPDLLAWGVEWRSKNQLDGVTRRLQWDHDLRLFRTRRECRAFIEKEWGYIKQRQDLRIEPHGWRLPLAVRVEVRKVKSDGD